MKKNLIALFILLFFSLSIHAQTLHIGILNTSGDEADHILYSETITALKAKLRPLQVVVTNYNLDSLKKAISSGQLNFFISNPGFAASVRQSLETTVLASQKSQSFPRADQQLGSVFVVLNKEHSPTTIKELAGRSICAVAPDAYGGLYVALGELKRRGIEFNKFFSEVNYTGYPMPKVFSELREGVCEIGFVRTCLLERLIAQGKIHKDEFKVIEPRNASPDELCLRSTELYPGWVLAATKNTSEELRKKVATVLYSLPSVGGNEWTVPRSFSSLDALYKDLKVQHFAYLRNVSWKDFLKENWGFLLIPLIILIAVISHNVILKKQVTRRTSRLRQAFKEKLLAHQTAAEAKRNLHEMEKINLIGMVSSMIAHELRQPMAVIRNYSEGLKDLINSPSTDKEVMMEALNILDEQAVKASNIVEHLRRLIKGKEMQIREENLSQLIPSIISSFHEFGGKCRVEYFSQAPSHIFAQVEPTQFEIVLLNLLNNAYEAISQQHTEAIISLSMIAEGEEIKILVANSGLLKDQQSFENLFAIKNSSKSTGLGLGLAISARIVERWGGRLSINQQNNKVIACIKLPIH